MPGQLLALQVWLSSSLNIPSLVIDNKKSEFELQRAPPASGNGLSQCLDLDWCPPSQVEEQLLQLSHNPHTPSTEGKVYQFYLKNKQVYNVNINVLQMRIEAMYCITLWWWPCSCRSSWSIGWCVCCCGCSWAGIVITSLSIRFFEYSLFKDTIWRAQRSSCLR